MKEITMYESFDGMRFSSREDCIKHETSLRPEKIIESWLIEKTNFNPVIIQDDDFDYHTFSDPVDAAPFLLKCIKKFCCPGNFEDNPIELFDYCIKDGSFGDICTVYYYDGKSDSFINLMPKGQP